MTLPSRNTLNGVGLLTPDMLVYWAKIKLNRADQPPSMRLTMRAA
jgi:hypothetical protein